MVLSDLGAEVIKIEQPGIGDTARGNGPFVDGTSSYFFSLNRGKKSVALNLKSPSGKRLFRQLVKKADVVVENMVPGSTKRLGLDYPRLRRQNPALIYAAISGFGQTGPYAQRPALDVIVQGMGGVMSITGEPGRPPVRPGVSLGDIAAGLFTAIAILAALQERSKSGRGQFIDISMLDCQVALQENAFARYFATGEIPQPLGTRHPVFTPFQAFQSKDGYLVVAIVGGANDQWPLFCATIGHLELMDDPRFQDGWSRTQHYDVLEPVLSAAFRQKTTQEWVEALSEVGIACGPVNNIAQVADDPHVNARTMFVEVPHPKVGKMKVVNTPVKLSRTRPRITRPAPELGEHTEEVLKKMLGLTSRRIQRLRDSGVLGQSNA
jgi:CoA:oxalate CoA-transferase